MKSSTSNKEAFKNLKDVFLRRNKNITENMFIGINVRELRATLILFVSILLFLLIFIPFYVAYIIYKLNPHMLSLPLLWSVYLMIQLNSMVNPFLNARTIKDANVILTRSVKFIFCQGSEKGTEQVFLKSHRSSKYFFHENL